MRLHYVLRILCSLAVATVCTRKLWWQKRLVPAVGKSTELAADSFDKCPAPPFSGTEVEGRHRTVTGQLPLALRHIRDSGRSSTVAGQVIMRGCARRRMGLRASGQQSQHILAAGGVQKIDRRNLP